MRSLTKAARRLHAELGTRKAVEEGALSRIDVFSVAAQLGAVLLFQRLKGLLGAYLAEPVSPVPGIVVSTERDLHVQRFTAAHELGHLYMKHEPTADEDIGLWRNASKDAQELAANAFASEFLLPQWLYVYHARRHRWTSAALQSPENTYQLSLRLGASYDAVCWGLQSHNILRPGPIAKLRATTPKDIKSSTLNGRARLDNSWADVWVITEADDGLAFEGTPDDIVIFQFPERASAGYLWDETQLREQGFDLIADTHEDTTDDDLGSMYARAVNSYLTWLHEEGHVPNRLKVRLLHAPVHQHTLMTPAEVKALVRFKPHTFGHRDRALRVPKPGTDASRSSSALSSPPTCRTRVDGSA